MELLWRYLFDKKLQCDPGGSYILLTEPSLNSKGSREKAAVTLFEYFYRLDTGGQQMTDYAIQTLQDSGHDLERVRKRTLAGIAKVYYCYLAQDLEGEARAFHEGCNLPTETSYALADGRNITVGKESCLAAEVFFSIPSHGTKWGG
ncbi:unnamed protein product [Clonostachys rosea]|uniref:Uncharacterized protein n=1 Tax=Bionectria ochroleuca TaxID=29856 RepID=A0ABY6U205_BIOOC|nr:unnamed protein product [Clonostachys rosea]